MKISQEQKKRPTLPCGKAERFLFTRLFDFQRLRRVRLQACDGYGDKQYPRDRKQRGCARKNGDPAESVEQRAARCATDRHRGSRRCSRLRKQIAAARSHSGRQRCRAVPYAPVEDLPCCVRAGITVSFLLQSMDLVYPNAESLYVAHQILAGRFVRQQPPFAHPPCPSLAKCTFCQKEAHRRQWPPRPV